MVLNANNCVLTLIYAKPLFMDREIYDHSNSLREI